MLAITSRGYVFGLDCFFRLFLVGTCIFAMGLIFSWFENVGKYKKIWSRLSTCCLIFTVMLVPLTFIANYKLSKIEWETAKLSTEYIISLKDNNLVENKNDIRMAYVEEKLYYQYYAETADKNGLINKKIPAEITTIVYGEKPRIEKYEIKRKWFIWSQTDMRYLLYLPKGSLIEEYKIDLE